jgi:hypothetical protein
MQNMSRLGIFMLRRVQVVVFCGAAVRGSKSKDM